MSEAAKYVGLVGKYVRMERTATDEEHGDFAATGFRAETVGCAGVVSYVADVLEGVEVCMDYGMGYVIRAGEDWRLQILADEETANLFYRARR